MSKNSSKVVPVLTAEPAIESGDGGKEEGLGFWAARERAEAVVTQEAAVAFLKGALAARRDQVPVVDVGSITRGVKSREEIQQALSLIYSDAQRTSLTESAAAVLDRFRFVERTDIVSSKALGEGFDVEAAVLARGAQLNLEGICDLIESHGWSEEEKMALRRAHPRISADGVLEVDLRGQDLSGIDLRFANLARSSLSGADLRGAVLQGATLYRADLQTACLFGTNLQGADLRKACLRGLRHESFEKEARLGQVGVEYNNVMQEMSNLLASTGESEEEKAYCEAMDARMQSVTQRYFTVQKERTTPIQPTLMQGANLRGAFFEGAGIEQIQMQGCNLRNVKFIGSVLDATVLTGADLRQAKFQHALLRNMDLSGAVVNSLPSLRASSQSNSVGGLFRQAAMQLCGGPDSDNDEPDDDDELGDDENESQGADDTDSDTDDIESEDPAFPIAFSETKLLEGTFGVVEQLGEATGKRAVTALNAAEAQLQRLAVQTDQIDTKLREIESKLKQAGDRISNNVNAKVSINAMLAGVRAQAKEAKKKKTFPAFLAVCDVIGTSTLLTSTESSVTQDMVDQAEEAVRGKMTKFALSKLAAAQLGAPTKYSAKGLLATARAVITTNPTTMRKDKVETERILERIDELLRHDVHEETWDEIGQGWMHLYRQHKALKAERGQLILEQIFKDPHTARAVAIAMQFRFVQRKCAQIGEGLFCPKDIPAGLKAAKHRTKENMDKYKRAADSEMLHISRIQYKQQQFVGLVVVIIGNLIGQVVAYVASALEPVTPVTTV